jgi:hypothetical protein
MKIIVADEKFCFSCSGGKNLSLLTRGRLKGLVQIPLPDAILPLFIGTSGIYIIGI